MIPKRNTSFFSFYKKILPFVLLLLFLQTSQTTTAQHSVAREWNEVLLHGIRNDLARPTVHARNLFHSSIAMYDAWAAYDSIAQPFFIGNTVGSFTSIFNGVPAPDNMKEAREEAMSFAVYRLMKHRFQFSPGDSIINLKVDSLMTELGYDPNITSINYSSGSPAALGNYIGQNLITFGLLDGANEQLGYANTAYQSVNPPLAMGFSGNPTMEDPNRWQPLTLDVFIDQSGNVIPFNTPDFLSPEWGQVTPFALTEDDAAIFQRDGFDYKVYHDPGPPPYLDTTAVGGLSEEYKWGFSMVAIWSSHLDPKDSVMIDISPGSIGNVPESSYPTTIEGLRDFYNYLEGGDPSVGHNLNPVTGEPYAPQLVPRADYARVLAEYWADGPDSETPPGHWFTILNYVNDHPQFEKRFRGQGPLIDELEWDVKAYLMMGGAMHDCAITAWGIKGWYDYLRPVSAIRYMADLGQSSDPTLPSYHPGGILLEPGRIEVVLENDALVGDSMQHLGKIKLYAWQGPDSIPNVDSTYAGVDWILAENWFPYQRPTFVTPNFAGFVSGHSTYSRAAADLLTNITGDEYFPGGMGEFEAPLNEFLVFEDGPSVDLTLQWATYRDASDQTSLSRIWGGIHPPADDIPGRLIGVKIAANAFDLAESLFFVDEDNDGFYSYEDCDDNNPDINPDVPETCDNIDNNCNGLVDDGINLFTYYADNDNDGFGSTTNSMDTCHNEAPMGFVENGMDCDDDNAAVNPNADEVCDNVDNDCSGTVDDGLPTFQYYLDADNDGFGNPDSTTQSCFFNTPTGYASNNDDCDDSNFNVNPNAQEVMDGLDNDCNGFVDDVVATDDLTNVFQLEISPNPVSTNLTVQYDYAGTLIFKILNVDGKVLLEKNQSSGNSTVLNVDDLPSALYILQIMNEENTKREVRQFVKY